MSVSEAFRGVVDESVESIELAPGANGFHLGRRNSSPGGISSWKRCGVQLNRRCLHVDFRQLRSLRGGCEARFLRVGTDG